MRLGVFRKNRVVRIAALICMTMPQASLAQATGPDAIALLSQSGHHAMVRHALAPGSGDPADFELGDCTTQRNLDAAGRAQAERLGDLLRQSDIGQVEVLSSEWCRTLETAQLMDLGAVTPFESLNSTWRRPKTLSQKRADEVRAALLARSPEDTAIFVTHAANIVALTGHRTGSGEGIVIAVTGNTLEVVGTFAAPRH